jgi:hypothetical protein
MRRQHSRWADEWYRKKRSPDPEENRSNSERFTNQSAIVSAIDAEFEIRRAEKLEEKARRDAERARRDAERVRRSRRSAANEASVVPQLDPAEATLKAYFNRTNVHTTPHVAVRVEMRWGLEGKRYLSLYFPATSSLEVWIEVTPGLPGSKEIAGSSYMPANDFRQLKQADIAERKARRPRSE